MSSYCYLGKPLECHTSLSYSGASLVTRYISLVGGCFTGWGMFNMHMHTPRSSSTLNVNSTLHHERLEHDSDVLKIVTLTRPVTNM